MNYHEDILGTIGNTPLVRLNKVTKDLKPIVPEQKQGQIYFMLMSNKQICPL